MKVVTGFSPKNDGFLIITAKPLPELAASLGLKHVDVGGDELFVRDDVVFDDHDLQLIADGEIPRGAYRVFVADYAEDVNLSDAVCW